MPPRARDKSDFLAHLDIEELKMATAKPPAIPGVRPDAETIIMVRWPSIACGFSGRLIGSLCVSIPVKIHGVKLSYLLFALLVAPWGALLYLGSKVTGQRYVITNRSVQRWKALGNRLITEVSLTDVQDVDIRQQTGQEFYKAADLHLLNASGQTIMRLDGVTRPEVFRQNILKSRDALAQVEASLATIQAR